MNKYEKLDENSLKLSNKIVIFFLDVSKSMTLVIDQKLKKKSHISQTKYASFGTFQLKYILKTFTKQNSL